MKENNRYWKPSWKFDCILAGACCLVSQPLPGRGEDESKEVWLPGIKDATSWWRKEGETIKTAKGTNIQCLGDYFMSDTEQLPVCKVTASLQPCRQAPVRRPNDDIRGQVNTQNPSQYFFLLEAKQGCITYESTKIHLF